MTRIFDISVPVANGGVVYPGNPEIQIEPYSELSKGASSNLSRLTFGWDNTNPTWTPDGKRIAFRSETT